MASITELAEQLGKAIAQSPQAGRLREAAELVRQDPEASNLLAQFRRQATEIARKEAEQKPIEPEEKRKLGDLQRRLASREALKKFTSAQVDYVDLMRTVNETIYSELDQTEQAARPA